jgi:hypothetical protein
MKMCLLVILVVTILLIGCSPSTQTGNPDWVDRLIRQFESDPVGNPPLSIGRYEYNGQVVYYVPPYCCDIPGSLFIEDSQVILTFLLRYQFTQPSHCPVGLIRPPGGVETDKILILVCG